MFAQYERVNIREESELERVENHSRSRLRLGYIVIVIVFIIGELMNVLLELNLVCCFLFINNHV